MEQTRNQVNDMEMFQLSDIPSEIFEKLQGLVPGVSKDDCEEVHCFFSRPKALEGFSKACRIGLENSILKFNCMIPSMRLFGAHMVFLENISICMRELLELDKNQGKRSQGCETPLEKTLKGLYTAEMNFSDDYQIQTIDGWRSIHAPFEDRQELSCRQLWLFVMRQGSLVDKCHFAYTAKRLGFSSDLIEVRAADYVSLHANRDVALHPSNWANLPAVTVKQRLGQKGNRWSEMSNSAKKYLFFDIAETVGTEVVQQAQKPKDVTTLVELGCIYRAFFGHPFFPSAYAKLPRTSEVTCLNSPTSAYPEGSYLSSSSLSSHGQGVGEIDSLSDDDWREANLVSSSVPFEQLQEGCTQTVRNASKQLCGPIENNDHVYRGSTSGYSSHVEREVGGRHSHGSSPWNREVSMTPYAGGNSAIRHLNSNPIEVSDHARDRNDTLASLGLLLTAEGACPRSQISQGLTDQNPKHIRPLNSATEPEGWIMADTERRHGRLNQNDDHGRTETFGTSSPASLPHQLGKVQAGLDHPPATYRSIEETTDQDWLTAQIVGEHILCTLDQPGGAGQSQQMHLQGRRGGRESAEYEESEPPDQRELNEGIQMGSPIPSLPHGGDEHYQRSMSLFTAESYNDEDKGQINSTKVANSGELEYEFEGTESNILLSSNAKISSPVGPETVSHLVSTGGIGILALAVDKFTIHD